jgi:hypothetical protein
MGWPEKKLLVFFFLSFRAKPSYFWEEKKKGKAALSKIDDVKNPI